MYSNRVYNFSAGPSCLPIEVLNEMQENLLNHKFSGMSVMEMSHRGKTFLKIFDEAIHTLQEILIMPETHKILFMQGGGTLQFSSIPLNFLRYQGALASYVVSGYWSKKAFDECQKFGKPSYAFDGSPVKYKSISEFSNWNVPMDTSYLYYCSNETISGLEIPSPPSFGSIPLISDMSSNLASKPIDINKYSLIFASAQKNLGVAGSTIVIIDKTSIGKALPICPNLCDYEQISNNNSLLNTPCCWSIYSVGLMSKFIKQKGGLQYWQEHNTKKAKLLYDAIDESDGFFSCIIDKRYRSNMNVTFNVLNGDSNAEKEFLEYTKANQLIELAGHRSVGGCRASIYNGFPIDGVYKLVETMKCFQEEYLANR